MRNAMHWYALKVFYNRFSTIEATLDRDGIESYIPTRTVTYERADGTLTEKRVPLVAMLMFLRCDDDYITELNAVLNEKAMVYHHPGTQIPAPIPDGEMEMFIRITTTMGNDFELKPFKESLIKEEDKKFIVVEGKYQGTEGYYKRIDNNRRLVVVLENLLMLVSTDYIPQRYLQQVG